MNRRQLLLCSASAFALAFRIPAMAATPDYAKFDGLIAELGHITLPIEKLGRINEALNTAQDYSVNLEEMATLFGLPWHRFEDFAALRDLVFDRALATFDGWDRVEYLVAIREKLDERFGRKNIAAHWLWMSSTPLTTWPHEAGYT